MSTFTDIPSGKSLETKSLETLSDNPTTNDLTTFVIHEYGDLTIKNKQYLYVLSRHIMSKFSYFRMLFDTYPDQKIIDLDDDISCEVLTILLERGLLPESYSKALPILRLAEKWGVPKTQIRSMLTTYLDNFGRCVLNANSVERVDDVIIEHDIQIKLTSYISVCNYESFTNMHHTRLKNITHLAMFYRDIGNKDNETYLRDHLLTYFLRLQQCILKYMPIYQRYYREKIFDKLMIEDIVVKDYFNQIVLTSLVKSSVLGKRPRDTSEPLYDPSNKIPRTEIGWYDAANKIPYSPPWSPPSHDD